MGAKAADRRFLAAAAAFAALLIALPFSRPLFSALFPWLDRPLYAQQGFPALVAAHLALALAASGIAAAIGIGAGILATRPFGRELRPLLDRLAAMGQTIPPVAVLALAVPIIGFGFWPALIALVLYSLLPICENTLSGLETVPADIVNAADGLGMSAGQRLGQIELPLALPVILAGLRSAVTINIGTAALASTVGATTLGTPIIVGLNGNNIAYVLQGAILAAALAIVVDLAFEAVSARLERLRHD